MQKIHLRHHYLSVTAVSLFLASLSVSSPAYAGFKWVGSDEVQHTSVSVAPPAAPVDAPIIISSPESKPALLEKSLPAVPPKAEAKDGIVRGFADSVPLSVALRQVLPPEVGFSVSQDISLGTLVSWRGGVAWRQVLKDMLAPAGLALKEQPQMVHIVRAEGAQDKMALNTLPEIPPARMAPLPPEPAKPMTLLPTISMDQAPVQRPLASSSGYLTPPTSLAPSPTYAPSAYSDAGLTGAWTANKGDMLQKTLETWGQRANVEISWQAEYDYPLQASVALDGSFEEAVRGLLAGFQQANPQPIGYLYNNQAAGQTVLVVQTRGNNYTE